MQKATPLKRPYLKMRLLNMTEIIPLPQKASMQAEKQFQEK